MLHRSSQRRAYPLFIYFVVIRLTNHQKKVLKKLRYGALNYPFVYRIFSRCAKGIAMFLCHLL